MRSILYITNRFGYTGGQETVVAELARAFSGIIQTHILCQHANAVPPQNVILHTGIKALLQFAFTKQRFDIIHLHHPLHIFTLICAIAIRSRFKIATFHARHYSPNPFKRFILKAYVYSAINLLPFVTDKFVFLSKFAEKEWKSKIFLGRPSTIIPNGLALSGSPRPKRTTPIKNGLFVGVLRESKGIYLLLEAAKARPDLAFTVVGRGNLKGEAPGNVILIGEESRNEVQKYYKSADFLVFPSSSEQCPLVLIVALAYGLPIICSACCGLNEMIEDNINGYSMKNLSSQEILNGIRFLSDNMERYNDISANNTIKYQAEYSMQMFVKRHQIIYGC